MAKSLAVPLVSATTPTLDPPTIVFLRDESAYRFLREFKVELSTVSALALQGHHIVGMEIPGSSPEGCATLYRVWIFTPKYREIPCDAVDPDTISPGVTSRSYMTDEPYFAADFQQG